MRRSAAVLWSTFAAVTIVIWVGRVRNIAADDDLTGAGRGWRLALAASFLVGGAAVAGCTAWAARQGWGGRPVRTASRAVAALAGWTTAVWLVRVAGISVDPAHGLAFKVVHAGLAALSIGLAAAAWRASPPASRGATAAGRAVASGHHPPSEPGGYAAARHGSTDRRH